MIWLDSVNGWRKVEWVEKVEQGELLQVQQRSWHVVEEVELNRLEKVVGDDLEVDLNKLEKVVESELNGRSVLRRCSKQTKDGLAGCCGPKPSFSRHTFLPAWLFEFMDQKRAAV